MNSYGFKTELPANTMSLSEYKKFKEELYNTTTIDDLNTIKSKYSYTKDIKINLLQNLLNGDKKDNSIRFEPYVFTSMIEKSIYVTGANGLDRANTIFKNHITGLIKNQLYTLLISHTNGHYTAKLKVPITNITKLLLFAHGDYSSMYSKELSELISKIKANLIAFGLAPNILVYTYDINDLILPDFTSKDALASFTAKSGKFDCIVPINCFNPKSFDYGAVAKKEWKQFVNDEFVNVINTNVKPDGYIITVGAEMDGEYATFLNFYKDTYHIVKEQHGSNTLHIIDLKNKLQTENVIPKKKNSSEEKAKQDAAAEQAKRDAEEKAKRDAERDAEEKDKRAAAERAAAERAAKQAAKREAEAEKVRQEAYAAKAKLNAAVAQAHAKYTSPKNSYTGTEESKINFIKYESPR